MKFLRDYTWDPRSKKPVTVEAAVLDVCTPDPYSYNGSIERTHEIADRTSAMLAKLMQRLHDKGVLDNEDVKALLGHGWRAEVEPPAVEEDDD